ncbi:hypothetical protein EUX98_g794 [Antrodiella citrinella]|uniref:Sodium/calcium exchanger membrane region domain-containing protein n=1 Tax=Antrodiella citrinella TaxID=2447956 RepID=A0A4S4NBT4_9APHY|nr:hypothetical protein EUX98_g794 [Antrodiella citrinella]
MLLLYTRADDLVGDFRFHQQEFQPMAAQLNSSLMTVSVISLLVPTAFVSVCISISEGEEGPLLLQLSRGSAVILILIYFAFLWFQFYSHNHLFMDTLPTAQRKLGRPLTGAHSSVLPIPTSSAVDVESARVNIPTAMIVLAVSTVLAYITAENLVSSLNGMVEHSNVSKEWLTLIVIPIISNAAEHATAVVVASKGKFDLALSVAVGSCIQIALFVIPLLILVPISVRPHCNFFIENGKSHWMSGVVLIGVYIVIALSFWNYPAANTTQPMGLTCH